MKMNLFVHLTLAAVCLGTPLRARALTLAASEVDIASIPSFDHVPVNIPFSGAAGALTVSSDAAWVSPSVPAGGAEIVLSFNTAALINAHYTATVTATDGKVTNTVFVSTAVAPLNVFRLADDPYRSRMYGIHLNGLEAGAVVVIDPVSGAHVACLTVGRQPTDLDLSSDGSELFVLNVVDKSVSVIDLQTLRVKETLALPAFDNWGVGSTTANLATGPGQILYYTDAAWAPAIHVFDRGSRQHLQSVLISGYGFGDIATTGDRGALFGWVQYGWSAGWVGSFIARYAVNADGTLALAENTDATYPTVLGRDPVETPALISADDATVFIKRHALSTQSLRDLKRAFPSDIYSISPGGEVAATATALYETRTGLKLADLPVASTVQAISTDYARLVYFDPAQHTLSTLDLLGTIGATIMGLDVAPADGAVTLAPAALKWGPVPGVDTYRVYFADTDVTGADTRSAAYRGEVHTPGFPLAAALTPGTTYYWRVDSVSAAGVLTGAVYSFTVSTVVSAPGAVNAQTVAGHAGQRARVDLASGVPGAAWSAAADVPWITLSQTNGVTPASLELTLDASALAPGDYTAQVAFSQNGAALFTLPVTFRVEPLRLTLLKSDRASANAYAVSEDTSNPAALAYLVEIDTRQEKITRVVPVGKSVPDIAVHNGDNRIYVPNRGTGALLAVDLSSFQQVTNTGYGAVGIFRLSAGGPGRLVVEEEDQWIYISIFDTATGALLSRKSMREGGGAFDPTGRYYYHGDNNISSASLTQFDVTGDTFTQLASARVDSYSYYGSRIVTASEDGQRVFWNGGVFTRNLAVDWQMGALVYACSADGRYAVGTDRVYDTVLRQAALGLPAATSVSAVNATTRKLVLSLGSGLSFYPLTYPIVLEAPVLTTNAVSATSVSLRWTDRTLELGFTLQQRVSGAAVWTDVGAGLAFNTTNCTVTGLTDNTAYEFRIKANATGASSEWSPVVTATTPLTPPSTPVLAVPVVTMTSVSLAWSNSDKEDAYALERCDGTSNNWSVIATPAANVTSAVDLAVLPERSYSYRVKALRGTSASAYSNVRSVTTPGPQPPAAPTFLRATTYSASCIRLSWTGVDSETGYRLERRHVEGAVWTQIAELPADAGAFDDTGVMEGSEYYYRLRAFNAVGNSPYSNEASARAADYVVALEDDFDPALDTLFWSSVYGGQALRGSVGFAVGQALYFSGGTARSATTIPLDLSRGLSVKFSIRAGNTAVDGSAYWENSESGENVLLEYSTDGVTWSTLQTLNSVYPQLSSWTSMTVALPAAALSARTQLRWRQPLHSGSPYDTWALDDVCILSERPQPPVTPPFVLASANSDTEVAIFWAASPGASKYTLERTGVGASWSVIGIASAQQPYFTDRSVLPNTLYAYRITASNAGGYSLCTSPVFVRTYTQLAAWLLLNYGTTEATGAAALSAVGRDGHSNLYKYAFNLGADDPMVYHQRDTGTQGLPLLWLDQGQKRLCAEFVRRKPALTPGITYAVECCDALGGAWAPLDNTVSVTPIDAVWERVRFADTADAATARARFMRVRVSQSP